jgi:N-sulfoglucosamine sulfohydrolase
MSTHRSTFAIILVGSLTAHLGLLAATDDGGSPTAPRPNILLYIADDMSWAHTSVGGDPAVKTPNFDQLAKSGVRFTHAFSSSPSCTPSRGALLTGQAFCRLEEGASLLSTLPARFPVYPDLLEQAGYEIGFSGKGWDPGDWRPGGRKRNPAGPPFPSLRAFLQKLPPGRPFCFWVGSHDPHRPYDAGSGVVSGIDPARIIVPPIVPDTPEIRRDLADYLLEVQRFDHELAGLLADLDSAGLRQNTLIAITSDNGMPYPRAKCSLYDWGTREPLAIAWPGKIPPNRVIDDFVSLTDLAPTFLEAAGVPRPAEMTGRSLLPTLLSHRSGRVETDRDRVFVGRERHDSYRLEDDRPVGYPMRALRTDKYLYIRNFKPDRFPCGDDPNRNQDNDRGPAKTFVVTHKDDPATRAFYDRAYGRRPAEELYDLAKDPGQLRNVAADAAHAQTRAQLQAELNRWMTELKDPRRPDSPDSDVFDRYPIRQRPR